MPALGSYLLGAFAGVDRQPTVGQLSENPRRSEMQAIFVSPRKGTP
jgi:hypothetical protein